MTATTRLYTALFGQLVGQDQFGNRYYRNKTDKPGRHGERRWVRYARTSFLRELLGGGLPDPSRVPPEWHGWLHHTLADPPPEGGARHHAWEKAPTPNLTGTAGAYLPQGHLLKGGAHAPTTSDYEPWRP